MKRNLLSFLIILFLLQIQVQTLTSCANIIPPTGGPRDSLPPVLVGAVPADSTLNFKTNKVTLSFNEYVQLDNQLLQTNLVVSPNPNQAPIIMSHLREVTIRLKDSLKPNTTYSINFGNALKDVNEGNPYKNLTYVFSTGNTIAGGELSGQVQLAQTGKTDSTLIVLLHKNLNDSAIKKLKADYYTRLDSGGYFHFRYLENGTYNVFVLPNDFTKKYDDSTKMFAFANEPTAVSESLGEPLMLYAYNEFEPGKESIVPQNTGTQPGRKKPVDTTKNIKFLSTLERGQQDLLSDLVISFPEPVARFDSSKISLTDTNYKAITNYSIVADTAFKSFSLKYPWKEEQYFKLVIQQDAFADSSGKTLAKNDTLSFQTSSESEYGSIRLRFGNLDLGRNPVLQFIQGDKIVDSAALTGAEFYRKLYKPGDYDLRILYDTDKNMTWTPGSYALKRQPEISIRIPRKLTIKPNWDNEVNINL
ncbi:MAG TPA: Ig-like domain-containing protein [Parafilimonas sp.]|nr:Ig-like domain-containing protein [Parafilimonas sp.]